MRRTTLALAAGVAVSSGALVSVDALAQPAEEVTLDQLLGERAPAESEASQTAGSGAAETLPLLPVAQPDVPEPALSGEKAPRRTIEEIVVTARRVAESMQDVPIAISAMSSDDLQREQINSMQDMQGRVPSLVIGTNSQMRNTETPSIRGQGAQFGAAPGVIIYFAEVPLPSDLVANNQGGPGKFFDLQNLQVLKGSQGTLFGRNTTGGALLLEPARPEETFSASLRADATSFSGNGYEAVVNLPLVGSSLLARAGIKYFDREGFTHDVASGKDYDNKHYWTARLGLTWRPTDRVESYLLGYTTRSRDNGTGNVIEDINREGLNQGILGALGIGPLLQIIPGLDLAQVANAGCLLLNISAPSTNCGEDILAEQRERGNRRVQLSADPNDILDTDGIIHQLSVDLSDTVTLRNIASYATFKHHYRWDLDGSRAQFIDYVNADDQFQADLSTVTEELQLQGNAIGDRLTYVIGGYYERTQAEGVSDATALFVQRVTQDYTQTKESYAPFAQTTLDMAHLSERLSGLNLTLGARYTFDETKGFARLTQTTAGGLLTLVDNPHDAFLEDSALTYTIGLDYQMDSSLFYGKLSRGYKTGGISVISVDPAHYTYDSEFVLNYEIGHKLDFAIHDVPGRINSAIYFTDYDNLQKASVETYNDPNSVSPLPQVGSATINAGKAELYGLELEASLQPLPGATFALTYAYTQAKYTEFNLNVGGVTPQLDCSGSVKDVGEVADFSCVPFQQTPEHNFSLSGRYLLPVDPRWGDIEASLTYTWNDRQYTSTNSVPEAEPGAWLSAQGLLNGSVRWTRFLGTALEVQVYGSNLTNENFRISNSNQWTFTYMRGSIYSEPRIIGVQLGYRWE